MCTVLRLKKFQQHYDYISIVPNFTGVRIMGAVGKLKHAEEMKACKTVMQILNLTY